MIAGDTDSFFLEFRGIIVPHQLLLAMATDGLLDSSNYPHDHPLYSSVGKAELGMVKDESSVSKSVTQSSSSRNATPPGCPLEKIIRVPRRSRGQS